MPSRAVIAVEGGEGKAYEELRKWWSARLFIQAVFRAGGVGEKIVVDGEPIGMVFGQTPGEKLLAEATAVAAIAPEFPGRDGVLAEVGGVVVQ